MSNSANTVENVVSLNNDTKVTAPTTPEWFKDRWMLDFVEYENGLHKGWKRMPFLTFNQLLLAIRSLRTTQIQDLLHDKQTKIEWKSIRIHSEAELDELVDKDGAIHTVQDDWEPICTMREYEFGTLYSSVADDFRTKGVKWGNKQYGLCENLPNRTLLTEEEFIRDKDLYLDLMKLEYQNSSFHKI